MEALRVKSYRIAVLKHFLIHLCPCIRTYQTCFCNLLHIIVCVVPNRLKGVIVSDVIKVKMAVNRDDFSVIKFSDKRLYREESHSRIKQNCSFFTHNQIEIHFLKMLRLCKSVNVARQAVHFIPSVIVFYLYSLIFFIVCPSRDIFPFHFLPPPFLSYLDIIFIITT